MGKVLFYYTLFLLALKLVFKVPFFLVMVTFVVMGCLNYLLKKYY